MLRNVEMQETTYPSPLSSSDNGQSDMEGLEKNGHVWRMCVVSCIWGGGGNDSSTHSIVLLALRYPTLLSFQQARRLLPVAFFLHPRGGQLLESLRPARSSQQFTDRS